MKEIKFRCLPKQLYPWSREVLRLPNGASLDEADVTEALFRSVFTDVPESDYEDSTSYAIGMYKCTSKDRTKFVRVWRGWLWPHEIPILSVTIGDEEGNVEDKLDNLTRDGILNGNIEIEKEKQKLTVAYKEEKRKQLIYFIISVSMIFTALASLTSISTFR